MEAKSPKYGPVADASAMFSRSDSPSLHCDYALPDLP